jgi:hypothetical protein
LRWIYGFLLAAFLFVFGPPVLQTVVHRTGYYDDLTLDQALLALILFLAAVAAIGRWEKHPPGAPPGV